MAANGQKIAKDDSLNTLSTPRFARTFYLAVPRLAQGGALADYCGEYTVHMLELFSTKAARQRALGDVIGIPVTYEPHGQVSVLDNAFHRFACGHSIAERGFETIIAPWIACLRVALHREIISGSDESFRTTPPRVAVTIARVFYQLTATRAPNGRLRLACDAYCASQEAGPLVDQTMEFIVKKLRA